MARHRFEFISAFLHVVTEAEETAHQDNPLKEVLPLYEHIKETSKKLYQPLKELSVNERMVTMKARSHLRQYIWNKSTKWGFKFWVLADITGCTIEFNLYCGRKGSSTVSSNVCPMMS